MKTILKTSVFFGLVLLLAACQPGKTPTPSSIFSGGDLVPYSTLTLTPTITPTPKDAPTATLAPTMTSTPKVYVVKENDTMIVIAYYSGLTVDELQAANPEVDPYLLTAGMTLLIPAPKGDASTVAAPTSTPYPLEIMDLACSGSITGGYYCFANIENKLDVDLSNISAEFRLSGENPNEVLTRRAVLPLSQVASGTSQPIFAYFESVPFTNPQVSVQLQTAMNAASEMIPVTTNDPQVSIATDGLSARVNGSAVFQSSEATPAVIWIAAVAYGGDGQVLGVRRFESSAAVNPGESIPFSMIVYAASGSISKVELFAEAVR